METRKTVACAQHRHIIMHLLWGFTSPWHSAEINEAPTHAGALALTHGTALLCLKEEASHDKAHGL